jgi:hypothetical protein
MVRIGQYLVDRCEQQREYRYRHHRVESTQDDLVSSPLFRGDSAALAANETINIRAEGGHEPRLAIRGLI